MYEKQGAILALATEKHRKNIIKEDELKKTLKKLLTILDECCIIWKREDVLSKEGDMLKKAEKSRDNIKEIFCNIKN